MKAVPTNIAGAAIKTQRNKCNLYRPSFEARSYIIQGKRSWPAAETCASPSFYQHMTQNKTSRIFDSYCACFLFCVWESAAASKFTHRVLITKIL
jgi:hypothetical protein